MMSLATNWDMGSAENPGEPSFHHEDDSPLITGPAISTGRLLNKSRQKRVLRLALGRDEIEPLHPLCNSTNDPAAQLTAHLSLYDCGHREYPFGVSTKELH